MSQGERREREREAQRARVGKLAWGVGWVHSTGRMVQIAILFSNYGFTEVCGCSSMTISDIFKKHDGAYEFETLHLPDIVKKTN